MVVAAEDDDRRAAGAVAGEPDRLRVRAGGRERELPGGQRVALAEQLGGLDRLLDRQQELESAGGALGDRREHGGRREAAGRAEVGLVEVDVGGAVDVGEAAAVAVGDEQRQVVIEPRHPRHRHAVGHRAPSTLGQRGGAPRAAVELELLARADRPQGFALDRSGHRCGFVPTLRQHCNSPRNGGFGDRGTGYGRPPDAAPACIRPARRARAAGPRP